jgi:hypothetical protein
LGAAGVAGRAVTGAEAVAGAEAAAVTEHFCSQAGAAVLVAVKVLEMFESLIIL